MTINNAPVVRKKILEVLRARGPSLPVQLAREAGISSLFAGAFLSELAREGLLKISNMKVGGSPLYYLKGQEGQLENFYKYLPGKEKEAFTLLKNNKILMDKNQEPAIRVALRNLKDFAVPFRNNEDIFWKFHSMSNESVKEIFDEKSREEKGKEEKEKPKKQEKKQQEKPAKKREEKERPKKQENLEKQLLKIKEKSKEEGKEKDKKEKSKFVGEVIDFFDDRNIQVLEEIEVKKKEYVCKVRVNSTLGKIDFFCVAKDKKRITESDLRLIFQKSQNEKLPSLIIYPKNISKKAELYAEDCGSLLILKKLERF
jgi:hypothetical protein